MVWHFVQGLSSTECVEIAGLLFRQDGLAQRGVREVLASALPQEVIEGPASAAQSDRGNRGPQWVVHGYILPAVDEEWLAVVNASASIPLCSIAARSVDSRDGGSAISKRYRAKIE